MAASVLVAIPGPNLDLDAAVDPEGSAAADLLGLRLRHTASLDLPIYGFQTEATRHYFLHNLGVLIAHSRVPQRRSMAVDRSTAMSPLDTLLAPPATNDFTKTIARFLHR